MRTTRTSLLLIVLSLTFGTQLVAQTTTPPAPRTRDQVARDLVEVTGAGKLGVQMMEQMMGPLQQAIPGLSDSFWSEFMAEVRPSELVDLIVPIYAKHFSLEELEGLLAFNRTPLGQKVITEMPMVMSESMAAGQEWGRAIGERAARKAAARRGKAPDKS